MRPRPWTSIWTTAIWAPAVWATVILVDTGPARAHASDGGAKGGHNVGSFGQRRASLSGGGELGEIARRVVVQGRRRRRGRQQGPGLRFQPRGTSDDGVRSRGKLPALLGGGCVSPRARARHRRQRHTLLHR